jgi:cold shock CspA family protein
MGRTSDIARGREGKGGTAVYVPVVVPAPKPRVTRRVGTVKSYSPSRVYGLVETTSSQGDAIFRIDDVAPGDRARLDSGQSVTFEMVEGPDGLAAKHVALDTTTLPPLPDETAMLKGWR